MSDPYFSSVSLLLHCDGSDASTSFPDNSNNAHTVTRIGDAQVDTAQSKWGGASALFDGDGDYLTIPDHTSVNLSTGDWTIEFWARWNTTASTYNIFYNGALAGVRIKSSTTSLIFEASTDGGSSWNLSATSSTGVIGTGAWYHVAMVRSGSSFLLFVNGTQVASTTSASALYFDTSGMIIGRAGFGASAFNGWLDDIRVTKGVARYTSSFSPPTAAFPNNVIEGAAAITLGAVTLAAAGNSKKTGSASITLGTVALAAAGNSTIAGAASITLDAVALVSTALNRTPINAAATITLDAVTLAAAGVSKKAGAAAITLGPVTLAASAESKITGAATITLGPVTLAASAGFRVLSATPPGRTFAVPTARRTGRTFTVLTARRASRTFILSE